MSESPLNSRFSKGMRLFITIASLVLLLVLAAFILILCYQDYLRGLDDFVWSLARTP